MPQLARSPGDHHDRPLSGRSSAFDPDDLVSAAVVADPYPAYRALRERSPLRYRYIPDGALAQCLEPMHAWAAMTYRDAQRVLRDHEAFSSRRPLAGRLMPRLVLLQDDPPRHTGFRALVRRQFAPDRIARLEPAIGRLAGDLLDRIGEDETDFISAFASPFPISVIARLMGLPEEEHRTFRRWSDMALSVLSVSAEAKSQGREEIEGYFRALLDRRPAGGTPETLIDILRQGRIEGAPLEDWEAIGFCLLLLVAGSETTTHLLGAMLHLLAHRPELWDRLRRDRRLVQPFIEEALRYESPLQRLTRVATRDVDLSQVRIRAGDSVVAFIGAANRDPTVFPEPDEFRLDRPRSNVLAFGSGIHHCLGAALARTEARLAVDAILGRFSRLEPGSAKAQRQTSKLLVLGYETLPLTAKRR